MRKQVEVPEGVEREKQIPCRRDLERTRETNYRTGCLLAPFQMTLLHAPCSHTCSYAKVVRRTTGGEQGKAGKEDTCREIFLRTLAGEGKWGCLLCLLYVLFFFFFLEKRKEKFAPHLQSPGPFPPFSPSGR